MKQGGLDMLKTSLHLSEVNLLRVYTETDIANHQSNGVYICMLENIYIYLFIFVARNKVIAGRKNQTIGNHKL